jgi:hypothetical protein
MNGWTNNLKWKYASNYNACYQIPTNSWFSNNSSKDF